MRYTITDQTALAPATRELAKDMDHALGRIVWAATFAWCLTMLLALANLAERDWISGALQLVASCIWALGGYETSKRRRKYETRESA